MTSRNTNQGNLASNRNAQNDNTSSGDIRPMPYNGPMPTYEVRFAMYLRGNAQHAGSPESNLPPASRWPEEQHGPLTTYPGMISPSLNSPKTSTLTQHLAVPAPEHREVFIAMHGTRSDGPPSTPSSRGHRGLGAPGSSERSLIF